MKTTNEYINLIKAHSEELRNKFGVRTLRLFGSVSRGEQKDGSDVDVCVEMEPRIYLVVRLKRFLEELLLCNVDVIHMHPHINPYLLNDINRDGIYVIN
jgi:predicted nucleotidyltransferase